MAKYTTLKPRIEQVDLNRTSGAGTKRIGGREALEIRERILHRDGYTCRNCKRVFRPSNLEVDHIVPLHLGGAESDENRQSLCIWCHKDKTNMEEEKRNVG